MKIQPLIGLASKRNSIGGAYRCWTAARYLDQPRGSGRVNIDDFNIFLRSMNMIERTKKTWVRQALELEIFKIGKSHKYYFYKGVPGSAYTFGAQTIMTPVNLIDHQILFSTGWLGAVWACFLESLNSDKPISREVLYSLSGVPESTQRYYERQATDMITIFPCVTSINEITEKDTDKRRKILQNLRDSQGDDSYRIIEDITVKQLPNVYGVTGANVGKKGRRRKSTRGLANLLNRDQQVNGYPQRIYFISQKAAENGAKQNRGPRYWFTGQDQKGINWYEK